MVVLRRIGLAGRRDYYLGAEVQTDWQVGSAITFKGEWNGKSYEDKGEILVFEPERKLAYSHWSPTGEPTTMRSRSSEPR